MTVEDATPVRRLSDAALGTAAVGVFAVAARRLPVAVPCPFLALTALPCPGCGMTRLADRVLHGHLLDALGGDPIGVAVLGVVGSLAALGVLDRSGLLRRTGVRPRLPARAAPLAGIGLAGALVVRWVGILTGVVELTG